MNKLMSPGWNRLAIQVLAASAGAALLSGCSADATRFNDPFTNPFTSPFASNTTAKPQHVASAKPVGTGRPAAVVAQALPPRPTTVASAGPVVSNETTGSIQATPPRSVAGASFGGWSATGGTAVVVAQDDTADALSKRYGVPQNVLLEVNGLKGPADIRPGARITVPIYNAIATAGNTAPVRVAVAVPAPLAHPVSVPKVRVAEVTAPAPRAVAVVVKTVVARPAKPEPIVKTRVAAVAPNTLRFVKGAQPVRTGAIVPPAKIKVTVVASAPVAAPAKAALVTKVVLAPARVAAAPAGPAPKVERVAIAVPAKVVDQTPTSSVQPAAPAADAQGGPEFRWPARGRIIQGFKGGAGGNDGINIAVPEGTAVKAAEGGTVIYAGTEMKAYGSMVLIRHPNGFISAYANNGEIDVKKGDSVKRGQTIAKSGQSGNVSSPQLHFELRKGRDPVDPTQYLAGL